MDYIKYSFKIGKPVLIVEEDQSNYGSICSFAPGVEVLGGAMLSVTEGLDPQVVPILARHRLVNVQADHWYSQQAWLDSFKEISTGTINAMLALVSIGMKIPETAVFRPGSIQSKAV